MLHWATTFGVFLRDMVQGSEHRLTYLCPQAALQVGLDASRIKLALRHKIEQTGMPFTTSDALIEAVLDSQVNEETVSAPSSSSSSSLDNIASRASEGEDEQQR